MENNDKIQYSKENFWRKIAKSVKRAGERVVESALTGYYCLQDESTPKWAKSVIYGALGYFIMPLDAIPDLAPGVGFSDDYLALAGALALVAFTVKQEHRLAARKTLISFFSRGEQSR